MQPEYGQMPNVNEFSAQGQNPVQPQGTDYGQTTGQGPPAATSGGISAADVANVGNWLLEIGQTIAVTLTQDMPLVASAFIKLYAGFLFIRASFMEANEQQIAPGQTTFANKLKISGSLISIVGAIILTWALLIEVQLKAQGVSFPRASVTPFFGGTGAFFAGA